MPDPHDGVEAAVTVALAREGVDVDDEPEAYRSPWWSAGLAEAAERTPPAPRCGAYGTCSPRSTRGAPRA